MEPDHETGNSTRSVAGATRSDGSATPDRPSTSVARSLKIAYAVDPPTPAMYAGVTLAERKTAVCQLYQMSMPMSI